MNKKESNKSFLKDFDIISFEEASEILFDIPLSFSAKEKIIKVKPKCKIAHSKKKQK